MMSANDCGARLGFQNLVYLWATAAPKGQARWINFEAFDAGFTTPFLEIAAGEIKRVSLLRHRQRPPSVFGSGAAQLSSSTFQASPSLTRVADPVVSRPSAVFALISKTALDESTCCLVTFRSVNARAFILT